jgi:adenosine 3'-phospho 5'-phosphosulfate transporter B3
VIGFFILNSFVEEFLFSALKDFKFGWYMTAFELLCFTGFAILERAARGTEPVWSHIAHYRHHLVVALAMTASRGLTNKSLEYLNYPTQVIFKSMKLITVMIGSIFILRQRFTVLEYVSAVALVLSAILFSLGDVAETPELGSYVGFVIVVLSLFADALHSNTQEQLLKKHQASVTEAMLFTNGFAAVMSFGWVVVSGELQPAMAFCANFPQAYLLFVVRAAVIYLGVLCFVLVIGAFGVVTATGITTVRKILTIIVSFLLFPKPISSRHVLGFFIFCGGIAVTIWDQKRKTEAKNAAATTLRPTPASVQLAQVGAAAEGRSNSVAGGPNSGNNAV